MTVVVLHEPGGNSASREFALLPRFEEIAARVAKDTRPDENDIADRGRLELHFKPVLRGLPTDKCRIRFWRADAPAARVAAHRYSRLETQFPQDSRPSVPDASQSLR